MSILNRIRTILAGERYCSDEHRDDSVGSKLDNLLDSIKESPKCLACKINRNRSTSSSEYIRYPVFVR